MWPGVVSYGPEISPCAYAPKLKALSYSSLHLNPTNFFTISVKGATIVLKSFTNLL